MHGQVDLVDTLACLHALVQGLEVAAETTMEVQTALFVEWVGDSLGDGCGGYDLHIEVGFKYYNFYSFYRVTD